MSNRFADAVIVAAGSSSRMAGVDKLDADLGGRPLLEWSVAAMAAAESVARIVIVTRADRVEPLSTRAWPGEAMVVAGGERRSDSVREGIVRSVADVVLVHDAARPLVSAALVDRVAVAARTHGAAVPVVPVVDSLKRSAGAVLGGSVDRDGLMRAQTPQGARRQILLDAFAAAAGQAFSDEAALLESLGVPVASVPGEPANMKVTEPADLELVRAIAGGGAGIQVGFGQDSHGFGPGDGLWLGGVLIETAPSLYGHSDGDVALHALATAVLASCGLGDLGRLFPANDSETEGIPSATMLATVLERATEHGWQVARAQIAIVGARPRLGSGWLDAIRARIAQLLSMPLDAVSVTASTGNLNGAEGAGRVISATALVGVHRR